MNPNPTIEKGTLTIDGTQLYYEVAGSGEAVVLSHAGFVDSGMWDAQWEVLQQHYRVVRYDMRGFGQSDPIQAPICRRDDLYKLLQHLDIAHATLIGCSLGGEIVLDLALEHPELVTGLVLVSAVPSGFELRGAPPPHLLEMIGAMQSGDFAHASELQLRIWVDGMFRDPNIVNPAVREKCAAMNQIAVNNMTAFLVDSKPLNPLNPPAIERLGDVHVPTLVIVGALDHPEILRGAELLTLEIPWAHKNCPGSLRACTQYGTTPCFQ
jgi:pimeloyl-ACP methyl ester carboxylesterase